jgi:hypothetical protein
VSNGEVALIIVGIFVLGAIIAIGISALAASRGDRVGEGQVFLTILGTFIVADIGAFVVAALVS